MKIHTVALLLSVIACAHSLPVSHVQDDPGGKQLVRSTAGYFYNVACNCFVPGMSLGDQGLGAEVQYTEQNGQLNFEGHANDKTTSEPTSGAVLYLVQDRNDTLLIQRRLATSDSTGRFLMTTPITLNQDASTSGILVHVLGYEPAYYPLDHLP